MANEAMENNKSSKKIGWLLKLELEKGRKKSGLGFLLGNLKEEWF